MANAKEFLTVYKQYRSKMREFRHVLNSTAGERIGFKIEEIVDTPEVVQDVKTNGVEFLTVTKRLPEEYPVILDSFGYILKDQGYSTEFVSRFPGLVVIHQQKDKVKQLANEINELKAHLATCVRFVELPFGEKAHDASLRQRNKHQKHKFIHELIPGVMTEQLYRSIQIIEEPVTNAWFNWTQRPVPKNFNKHQDAINWLNDLRPFPRRQLSKEQWGLHLDEAIIKVPRFDFIQHHRLLRNIPICTYQAQVENSTKRFTKNANTPFLLFGQPANRLPRVSDLSNWDTSIRDRKQRDTDGVVKEKLLDKPLVFGVNRLRK